MRQGSATVAQLPEFDEIVDVRSPAEFEQDRIPGAINCPALDNAQRAEIGTLYVQVSPFEARKRGAALVARNIADHLLARFQDKPKSWRPLIYCWRGGQRSGAFVTIFRQIGWDACQLHGGYKSWRHHVVAELEALPARLDFRVICGATGSGKTRLLHALSEEGAQVLDLETLATHRGSLLGGIPGEAQPGQKLFETRLFEVLRALDPARPVFVEAESRRIGRLNLPTAMIERMRNGACLRVDSPMEARVAYLLEDYAHFLREPESLIDKFQPLKEHLGKEIIGRWQKLLASGSWSRLVEELLTLHYDPLYRRSQGEHFRNFKDAPRLVVDDLAPDSLRALARRIVAD